MPRFYIDTDSDRDALFADRNLVTVEFAADRFKVSPHMLEKAASRSQGPFLMWVFGTPGQVMRKYRELYIDMGPAPGPDRSDVWRSNPPQELLSEARGRQGARSGTDGLHASR